MKSWMPNRIGGDIRKEIRLGKSKTDLEITQRKGGQVMV